jgi:hypothetical protein
MHIYPIQRSAPQTILCRKFLKIRIYQGMDIFCFKVGERERGGERGGPSQNVEQDIIAEQGPTRPLRIL